MLMFSFERPDEAEWTVVSDGVMGGRSSGVVEVSAGTLRFTGTLVTQGGGFALARAQCQVDLTGCSALALHVRGSGRTFQVELRDGTRVNGASVSWRAGFETTSEWQDVRVPIATLQGTVRGQAVDVPPIDLERVQSVGLFLADRNDGAFRLEVARISAVQVDSATPRPPGRPTETPASSTTSTRERLDSK